MSLGELANPKSYNTSLALPAYEAEHLLSLLGMMIKIRRVEEIIADLIESGHVKCPCHLGIGQEAIAVGVAQSLRSTDKVFGTHRAHAHYLSLGACSYELLAEVLGKVTGCSKGMGGSMHLLAKDKGFYGSVPIVGGTIPLAAGAALAAKLTGTDDISVCFFGDGAAEEGVLHETLNLASIQKLPVLFVCENNLYSSHLDIKLRQPSDRVARYAEAHRISSRVVDGNDIFAVETAAKELINDMRAGKGPGFLEAVTYRWRGHVGPSEDVDVGVRRSVEDLLAWKMRDPVRRLADAMLSSQQLSQGEYDALQMHINQQLEDDLQKALSAPYPDKAALLNYVYSE